MLSNLPGVFPILLSCWGPKQTRHDAFLEGGYLQSHLHGGQGWEEPKVSFTMSPMKDYKSPIKEQTRWQRGGVDAHPRKWSSPHFKSTSTYTSMEPISQEVLVNVY
ncbi:hypothetical protein VULLAG_LOCUS11310 [Vulpes lagopus]